MKRGLKVWVLADSYFSVYSSTMLQFHHVYFFDHYFTSDLESSKIWRKTGYIHVALGFLTALKQFRLNKYHYYTMHLLYNALIIQCFSGPEGQGEGQGDKVTVTAA